MGSYNIHGGHSLKCRGASGYLDEVNEDRKVKDEVIRLLKEKGHTVYDCTDDTGATSNTNLKAIVEKCNKHTVDLDVSIHLNAGGGTGVEVWNYSNKTKDISDRICSKISNSLGIKNRGTKYSTSLYVLKNTKSPAILIECCFVDSKTDYEKWDYKKCASAIVSGILNCEVVSSGWILDKVGWWYRHSDGSYTKNDWEKINGKWYYFDEKGYMKTGWIQVKEKWYYLDSNGAMITGLKKINNEMFYFASDGHMCETNDRGALV